MPVVVEISDRAGGHRSLQLDLTEIMIGRTADNHVTLPKGNISKRHARLVIRDDKLIIVDLKSTNGTFVNGRRISSPQVIDSRDEITAGDFALRFRFDDHYALEDEDTLEVDPTELRLLAGIAQREEGARMVYADWLETREDPVRAEFLRLQEEVFALPDGERFCWVSERMRILAEHIPIEWRTKVARPLIENCLGFEVECPKEWGALAPTERAGVRHCDSCKKRVYYCGTVADARRHAFAGDCVAVDLVAIRRPGDLEPERSIRMGRVRAYRDD